MPSLDIPGFPAFIGPGAIPLTADAMRAGLLTAPPDPFALDAEQRARLEQYRRPPAALGGLWREVEAAATAEPGRTRTFSLAESIGRLGELLGPVADQVAGSQVAAVLPKLDGLLDALDWAARGRRAAHPVRDLPEPTAVRPVIGRLVIRARAPDGASERVQGELRTFVATLRERLDSSTYPVSAAGVT